MSSRRLVNASVSDNTRRAYLAELHDAGRAASSAALAVAAARFRAGLAGQADPAGEQTARVLAGYRRTAGDRGQARSFSAAAAPAPAGRVVLLSPQMIGLRFSAAARAAGIERRVTAHSGRVGLANELTRRGASTTDVMLAGNWKTSRMVAHYSAGATAERGAVARYL